jgi:hypothetical protein
MLTEFVAEVVAILVGPGYWPQRAGLIGELAGWIGGGRRVRVDWSDVREINSSVELKREATALGLGRGDGRLRPYLEKVPGAHRHDQIANARFREGRRACRPSLNAGTDRLCGRPLHTHQSLLRVSPRRRQRPSSPFP